MMNITSTDLLRLADIDHLKTYLGWLMLDFRSTDLFRLADAEHLDLFRLVDAELRI